jgi:hypothetical protein
MDGSPPSQSTMTARNADSESVALRHGRVRVGLP